MEMLGVIAISIALAPVIAQARETVLAYSMEEPFAASVQVGPEIHLAVEKLYGRKLSEDCDGHEGPLLEATSVKVGPKRASALLVKPAAACLCGTRSCHFWLFLADTPSPTLLAEVHSHSIELMSGDGSAGVNEIQATSESSMQTAKAKYRFDGAKFKLVSTSREQRGR